MPGHDVRCWVGGVGRRVGSVYVVVADGCREGMWAWLDC
jgi:hypothetical protein